MNKKIVLATLFSVVSIFSNAQKSNIQSVINYIQDNDITEAKKMIDETVMFESTSKNAKAWLLKAVIYQAIATPAEQLPQITFNINGDTKLINISKANTLASSTPDANKIAIEAYKNALTFDPKYSKEDYLPLLQTLLAFNFNNGITAMNESKFEQANKDLGNVVELSKMDIWKGMSAFDTLFANAKMYQGNCAYQTSSYDQAIPLLEEASKSPLINTSDVFIMLSDIYESKKNDAKWEETMKAAKARYPNDKRIINNEINYYSNSGKTDVLIAKLKEGISLDPKKADLYIILGQTLYGIANPEKGTKPANAKEMEQDALAQYNKAAEIEPNNSFAQFYLGLVYFNQAKNATDEMNKADDKKYAAMKPVRDALLEKSLPYLEKARTLIDAEKVNDSNKETYMQVLNGLLQIYNLTGKADKAIAIQTIINKNK